MCGLTEYDLQQICFLSSYYKDTSPEISQLVVLSTSRRWQKEVCPTETTQFRLSKWQKVPLANNYLLIPIFPPLFKKLFELENSCFRLEPCGVQIQNIVVLSQIFHQ